jgi:hypothetical protein
MDLYLSLRTVPDDAELHSTVRGVGVIGRAVLL